MGNCGSTEKGHLGPDWWGVGRPMSVGGAFGGGAPKLAGSLPSRGVWVEWYASRVVGGGKGLWKAQDVLGTVTCHTQTLFGGTSCSPRCQDYWVISQLSLLCDSPSFLPFLFRVDFYFPPCHSSPFLKIVNFLFKYNIPQHNPWICVMNFHQVNMPRWPVFRRSNRTARPQDLSQWLPTPSSELTTTLTSYKHNICLFCTLYKWNHTEYALLCLGSLPQHSSCFIFRPIPILARVSENGHRASLHPSQDDGEELAAQIYSGITIHSKVQDKKFLWPGPSGLLLEMDGSHWRL